MSVAKSASYALAAAVSLVTLTASVVSLTSASEPVPAAVPMVNAEELAPPAPEDERPNVVVILTDDMRADELEHMPATRRLMRAGGMEFTDAVSPHPLCCPARAELVTGQYAQNNGVQHNSGPDGGWRALDSTRTIATWHAESGYHNGFVGKYLNHYAPDAPDEPGWHAWHPLVGGVAEYFNFRFHDGTAYTGDYVTNRIEERTNATLTELSAAGRPFLVFSNHLAPHDRRGISIGSHPPPAEAQHSRYARKRQPPMRKSPAWMRPMKGSVPRGLRGYTASQGGVAKHPRGYYTRRWRARVQALQSVDEAVASLYATLEERGELANTYVFFTSDNGYSLGERRMYKKNILVDEVLRVPLLVTGPGIRPGTRSALPVTLVDLTATIAELTSTEPTLALDGVSFSPTLAGERQTWRDTTLIQTGAKTRKKAKFPSWAMRGVRTKRYTYALDVNSGDRLLFDRRKDPFERVNRAGAPRYKKVVRTLDRRTTRLSRCAGDSCNRTFGKAPKPRRR